MIANHCTEEEPVADSNCESGLFNEILPEGCRACGKPGAPVSRKTMLLMLKPDCLERAFTGVYHFCSNRKCDTVYFGERLVRVFTIEDLRVIVGVKANSDPIPLCYCFGFEESHVRKEISQTGSSTIAARISQLIREGMCACETRNPSGVCCLGEVNRSVKGLEDRPSSIY